MKFKAPAPLIPSRGPNLLSRLPLDKFMPFYEQYKPAFAAGGVALAVLLLFAILYARHSGQVAEQSSARFRDALNMYNFRVPPPGSDTNAPVSSDEEKWSKAHAGFQLVHDSYPGSRLAPMALYYMGNCRYRLKQYSQALEAYEQFVSRYGRHALAAEAWLAKGDCLDQLGRQQEAYDAYKKVMEKGGPLAAEASLGVARVLLKLTETDRNRWGEAVDILNRLSAQQTPQGARARALRRLLGDLSPKPAPAANAAPAR